MEEEGGVGVGGWAGGVGGWGVGGRGVGWWGVGEVLVEMVGRGGRRGQSLATT